MNIYYSKNTQIVSEIFSFVFVYFFSIHLILELSPLVGKIVVNTQMISGLISPNPNLSYLRNSVSDLTVGSPKYATQNISNLMQDISEF